MSQSSEPVCRWPVLVTVQLFSIVSFCNGNIATAIIAATLIPNAQKVSVWP